VLRFEQDFNPKSNVCGSRRIPGAPTGVFFNTLGRYGNRSQNSLMAWGRRWHDRHDQAVVVVHATWSIEVPCGGVTHLAMKWWLSRRVGDDGQWWEAFRPDTSTPCAPTPRFTRSAEEPKWLTRAGNIAGRIPGRSAGRFASASDLPIAHDTISVRAGLGPQVVGDRSPLSLPPATVTDAAAAPPRRDQVR
jgi:hypothetical protein